NETLTRVCTTWGAAAAAGTAVRVVIARAAPIASWSALRVARYIAQTFLHGLAARMATSRHLTAMASLRRLLTDPPWCRREEGVWDRKRRVDGCEHHVIALGRAIRTGSALRNVAHLVDRPKMATV